MHRRSHEYEKFIRLMDQDSKDPALKEVQGRIWEEGYLSGELCGEVFDDVPRALERWRREGVGAGIFSSGSVLAQKLLFRHSTAGDLTPFLRWHFDTAVGPKVDPQSYCRIASAMDLPPADVTFVSDVVRELDAARSAGFRTALTVRPGNPAQPLPYGHAVIHSLDEVSPAG